MVETFQKKKIQYNTEEQYTTKVQYNIDIETNTKGQYIEISPMVQYNTC